MSTALCREQLSGESDPEHFRLTTSQCCEVHPPHGDSGKGTPGPLKIGRPLFLSQCPGKLNLVEHWSPVGPGTVAMEGRVLRCSGATPHSARRQHLTGCVTGGCKSWLCC